MNHKNAITIWFTGLSASGKSTLSEKLYKDLRSLGVKNVVLLDGESFRDTIQNNSFDKLSREEIGIKKAEMCLELNRKGKLVLVSGIAHKKKGRNYIRNMMDNYFEVYLDCDVVECAKRDFKGHYDKAFSGELTNFIGVSEPYEESDECDLILHTGVESIDTCSELLLRKIKQMISI